MPVRKSVVVLKQEAYCRRRTVPMVNAVRGNFDLREVLDTGDTDFSDTAEEIKSYHSVLMVSESHAGAIPWRPSLVSQA